MAKLYQYQVQGKLQFPVDMLRYDASYPASSEAASNIGASIRNEREFMPEKGWLITLYGPQVTPDRWFSFGWRVVSQKTIR